MTLLGMQTDTSSCLRKKFRSKKNITTSNDLFCGHLTIKHDCPCVKKASGHFKSSKKQPTAKAGHRISSIYWEHLTVNKTVLVCKMLEGALHINQTNIRRLNKLDKLELAHRSCRSIKLSNNPSGKKATLLASSPL